jgi:hypothetical protein
LIHRDIEPQKLLLNPPPTYMQQHKFMEEVPRYRPKLWYNIESMILLAINDIPNLYITETNTLFPVPNNDIGEEACKDC